MSSRASAVRQAITCWYTLSISVPSRSNRNAGAGGCGYAGGVVTAQVWHGGRFHAPLTATTPCMVPIRASVPDRDGEAKCGSAEPSRILCRTWPVPGSSWYSTPAFQSGTQTAPPPSTGEPAAAAGRARAP